MAFRADEEADKNLQRAFSKLIPRECSGEQRQLAREAVLELVERLGPVIDSYPSWHPLVSDNNETGYPVSRPGRESGYFGLDHTVYFLNGFVTCPYDGGKEIIECINNKRMVKSGYFVNCEVLDVALYHTSATAVVVSIDMSEQLCDDGTIGKRTAIGLMLENEIPAWRHAEVAESWENMRPYFLGQPHGARSSLFINQDTGQAIKRVWNSIISTGLYGPIMDD